MRERSKPSNKPKQPASRADMKSPSSSADNKSAARGQSQPASTLLQMQRTAGNRAVVQLLREHKLHGQKQPGSRNPYEADVDANVNANAEASHDNTGIAPIQRQSKEFKTNYSDKSTIERLRGDIEKLVQKIDDYVTQARKLSMQWRTFENESNRPYLQQWYAAASKFVKQPDAKHKLIHARFGYAIETLACEELGDTYGKLTVDTQVSSGHTRPDIVVYEDNEQVAWIDITSANSENHIKGKSGAGWTNRPFVYEILYDPLDLSELLEASSDSYYNDYGTLVAEENQIVYEEKEKARTRLRDEFIGFMMEKNWDNPELASDLNMANRRKDTKNFLFMNSASEDIYEEEYSNNMQQTKGALNYLGLNYGPFGFTKGNIKQDRTVAKKLVKELAQESIETRKTQLIVSKNINLAEFLKDKYPKSKAVNQFYETTYELYANRDLTQTGFALKAAFSDLDRLELLNDFYNTMLADNEQSNKFKADLELLFKGFPDVLDFKAIMEWRDKVNKLDVQAKLLYNAQKMHKQFVDYTKQKYTFFNRPIEVTEILIALSNYPQHGSDAIDAAEKWMEKNPIVINVVNPMTDETNKTSDMHIE